MTWPRPNILNTMAKQQKNVGLCVFILGSLCCLIPLASAAGASVAGSSHWILDEKTGLVHQVWGSPYRSGCSCIREKYNCGCCAAFDFPKIGLNDTGCVNVTYLPEQYGVSFLVSLDGHVIYNETVSAKNPPPICFGIPHLEKAASLCVDFYNMDYANETFAGCIKVEARLYHVLVDDIDLGCFKIPLSTSPVINAVDYEKTMNLWLTEFKRQQHKKKITYLL